MESPLARRRQAPDVAKAAPRGRSRHARDRGRGLDLQYVHAADQVEPLSEQINRPARTFYGAGATISGKCRRRSTRAAWIRSFRCAGMRRSLNMATARRVHLADSPRRPTGLEIANRLPSPQLGRTAVHRFNTSFGDRFKNRSLPTQFAESKLRCKLLNSTTFAASECPAQPRTRRQGQAET